jgi:hypothetical protein
MLRVLLHDPVHYGGGVMFNNMIAPTAVARRWLLTGLVVGTFVLMAPTVTTAPASAQQSGRPPAEQATIAPATRVFTAETGLVLNFIKPDKTADFEAAVAKLKEALSTSANPVRKQQAAGWRVYKASEPAASGSALYVFIVDPPVKGADYSVAEIFAEAFSSAESTRLLKQYAEAYGPGQNFVNLTLVSDFGK